MAWLAAWFTTIRGAGWFTDQHIGNVFLLPDAWQGWVILAIFFAALVVSIPLPADFAWPLRIAVIAGYLGLSYWTGLPG